MNKEQHINAFFQGVVVKLHIRERFYNFLWKVGSKREVSIEGNRILYMRLPFWMLLSTEARTKIGGSCMVAHNPSKTAMIFISSRNPVDRDRCTIWHEYVESCYVLQSGPAEDVKSFVRQANILLDQLRIEAPELFEQIKRHAEKKENMPHIIAIIFELDLAKREMEPERFLEHVAEAIRERL